MSPGGTEGGGGKFALGFLLSAVALYFFFDSVLVDTRGSGWISGAMRGGRGHGGGGMGETTSMGLIFLPFFIGIIALFYNAKLKWGWYVTWIGLAVIVIEIVSRIRFLLQMKVSHLVILIVVFAAGAGLMLQSYKEESKAKKDE